MKKRKMIQCLHMTYVLMDVDIIMSSVFCELIKCPTCKSAVEFKLCVEAKQGLSNLFEICCKNSRCTWSRSFYSSKESKRKARGAKHFDVNLRSILAFREIGKLGTALKSFCGYMNMPPPMTINTYNDTITDTMLPVYLQVVKEDMQDAAEDLHLHSTVIATMTRSKIQSTRTVCATCQHHS